MAKKGEPAAAKSVEAHRHQEQPLRVADERRNPPLRAARRP
jgi:hypothetical protein